MKNTIKRTNSKLWAIINNKIGIIEIINIPNLIQDLVYKI
jgi:hypothetical protein